MKIRVTAEYEVPEGDEDLGDRTGLTPEAHDDLTDTLMSLGFEDITFTRSFT